MTTHVRSRSFKALVVGAAVSALILGGGVASASASDSDLSEVALSELRANLTAPADIAAFDALSVEQEAQLAGYLLGETDPFAELSATAPRDGDFELRTVTAPTPAEGVSARAATRSVSAWQSFLFAGITISKTTVRETYNYSGANATSVAAYSCVVDANYDPYSQITVSKAGAYVSGGKATAECKVSVKRGVPTPWGPISWSTASNVQYVTGNGAGTVTSHGWR
ncbi:hypothetical protein [Microbacterium phyllosphaerae]|uniref:hypothetical protein n=1 Tax=Microbacterium phyllosphaerae TaxID=124798 RepID=UPI003D65B71C